MDNGIAGKVVLITGASSGIGEATALLSQRGAKVVLGARRLDRIEALDQRIVGEGGASAYARTDVTRRQDLADLVRLACERFGKPCVAFAIEQPANVDVNEIVVRPTAQG